VALLEDEDAYQRKSEEAKKHAQSWTISHLAVKLEEIYKVTIEKYTPPKKIQ
jgi:hypothetical protein